MTQKPEVVLTPREQEVLELSGSGFSNKEIARRLDISYMTVKTHLHNVYVKFEVSGRIKAFIINRKGLDEST
jgi:DNA-binding CsgD family transcriptional regulator